MAKDYLSELFKSVYTETVFEWKKQGLSDQDIINKLSQDTINDSLKAVLEQSAKAVFLWQIQSFGIYQQTLRSKLSKCVTV